MWVLLIVGDFILQPDIDLQGPRTLFESEADPPLDGNPFEAAFKFIFVQENQTYKLVPIVFKIIVSMFLFEIGITFSPLVYVSSFIIDAPAMLYLGLPLLITSFPRPEKFWEELKVDYSSGNDSPLYSSLAPTLMNEIASGISTGKISLSHSGTCLLARYESKILIIRLVEYWHEGATVYITGTELEPTSCHSLEGTEVDHVLDAALDERHMFNQNLLHTLLLEMESLLSYRDIPANRALVQHYRASFPTKWFDLVKQSSVHYNKSTLGISFGRHLDIDESIITIILSGYLIMLGIESFRYTVKYLYDVKVLDEPVQDMEDLYKVLSFVSAQWFVTVDLNQQIAGDPTNPAIRFQRAIANGVAGVFQLSVKKSGDPLRVRLLIKNETSRIKIARMNSEALKGIWANLLYELLYLTNDDDERFSIQAHTKLLRNLTIQASHPPFGYPLWLAPSKVDYGGGNFLAEAFSFLQPTSNARVEPTGYIGKKNEIRGHHQTIRRIYPDNS
ncbi:Pecanex-like protein 4 [Terramyces sp. JEL0728]|nr:Pecanex-like protein 4 [Terramyces sp. JEL0728]